MVQIHLVSYVTNPGHFSSFMSHADPWLLKPGKHIPICQSGDDIVTLFSSPLPHQAFVVHLHTVENNLMLMKLSHVFILLTLHAWSHPFWFRGKTFTLWQEGRAWPKGYKVMSICSDSYHSGHSLLSSSPPSTLTSLCWIRSILSCHLNLTCKAGHSWWKTILTVSMPMGMQFMFSFNYLLLCFMAFPKS